MRNRTPATRAMGATGGALLAVLALLLTVLAAPAANAAGATPASLEGRITFAWTAQPVPGLVSWEGEAEIRLEPGSAARDEAVAALRAAAGSHMIAPGIVRAARVTSLRAVKEVSCRYAPDVQRREAGAIVQPLAPFRRQAIEVDLLRGKGSMKLTPYHLPSPPGARHPAYLPVTPLADVRVNDAQCDREGGAGTYPVFGVGRDEIMPFTFAIWLEEGDHLPLRRVKGVWRVQRTDSGTNHHDSFAPITMRRTVDLRLHGALSAHKASCRLPEERIERMRSLKAALRLARRAGFPRARYGGTRRFVDLRPGRLVVAHDRSFDHLCGTRSGPRIFRSR